MSQEINAPEMPEVNADVKTTTETIDYHYKSTAEGTPSYNSIQELIKSGKLSADDVETDTETGKIKRKSQSVKVEVPVVEVVGFTAKQNDHVRELILKKIELANRKYIDKDDDAPDHFKPWYEVLQEDAYQRSGGGVAKVTKEMNIFAAELLKEFLKERGYGDGVQALVGNAAMARFSPASLKGVELPVVEKIAGIITQFAEHQFEMETQEDTEAAAELQADVSTLWNNNLNSMLKPSVDVSVADFDL